MAFTVPLNGSDYVCSAFPGLRCITRFDVSEWKNFYIKILENQFNEYAYLHHRPTSRFMNISFQATPGNKNWNGPYEGRNKKDKGFIPHIDNMWDLWCNRLFASSIWLNTDDECSGGTAFWKNRYLDSQCFLDKIQNKEKHPLRQKFNDTCNWDGVKSLKSFNKIFTKWDKKWDKWMEFEKDKTSNSSTYKSIWDNFNYTYMPTNSYNQQHYPWTESNEGWELVGVSPMKYNRMTFYQSIYFRSAYILDDSFNDVDRISIQQFI